MSSSPPPTPAAMTSSQTWSQARPPSAATPKPRTPRRVLYGVHDGGIPGTDHPTNKGVDPYVATRGEEGWSTEYVGIPADDPFSDAPFSSTPSGADAAPRNLRLRRPGCLLALLWRRLYRRPGPPPRRRTGPGHGPGPGL